MSYVHQSSQATEAKIARMLARIVELEAQLADTTSELHWHEQLLSNPDLTGNQVKLIYAARLITAQPRQRNQKGLAMVYRKELAEVTGLAEKTISTTLKDCERGGIIERDHAYNTEDGINKELYIGLTSLAQQDPGRVAVPDREPKDKKVKYCPDCRSFELEEKHYYKCKNCGVNHKPQDIPQVSVKLLEQERYPEAPREALTAEGITAPDRACFLCGEQIWMPGFDGKQWGYHCASEACHPVLIASFGYDLTEGNAVREERKSQLKRKINHAKATPTRNDRRQPRHIHIPEWRKQDTYSKKNPSHQPRIGIVGNGTGAGHNSLLGATWDPDRPDGI